jgi:excisionase family DNA binding protein
MTKAKRKRRDVGLLTPQQVASQTCVPLRVIRAMIEAGDLRSIGAGNRRFVFASEIKKLMDAA